MAVYKCKICGGNLEIIEGSSVCTCGYCGTEQTLPRLDSDRKVNLYDRANHFRRNGDFDKAIGIYEQILNEDTMDSEAYWSLVLCKYGIEYVEDPASHSRIPTVHRTQYTSIYADEDYKSALEYANPLQKNLYEKEAQSIDEIQKGILAISEKEEPFDIFICYKETDSSGNRTPDSVLANDIYYNLTNEGFHVFFSRISLENIIGQSYEPYIFAALNSARVMVVIGTKPEHFQAVWVRNEWSRFLALSRQNFGKILIPAYRDMDPYDLPEEFSHLQAQDMGKLGFMQDLIRGVEKILSKGVQKTGEHPAAVLQDDRPGVTSLLRRGHLFLEDEEWENAYKYFDKVLDIDPENAEAYLGQLLAIRRAHNRDELVNQENSFEKEPFFQKALRFADANFRTILTQLAEENKRIVEKNKRIVEEKLRLDRKRLSSYRKHIAPAADCIAIWGHTVGLKSNGSVVATGRNAYGECNVSGWNDIVAIAAGENYSVGLKSDGSVVAAGRNAYGECNVSGWSDIVAIATGGNYSVGLKSDGSVVATGLNTYGECNVSGWNDIVAIATGSYHTVGLKSNGSVVATDWNGKSQCNVSGWSNIVAIAAGNHIVGLKSDGSVVATGLNTYGECNVSGWSDIVAIATGGNYSVGLKSDGSVVATGWNAYGECNVSSWSDIVAIAAIGNYTIGLKSDGSVVATGWNGESQCNVSGWSNIVAIAVDGIHTIGLKSDGSVVAIGQNDEGQCNASGWRLFQDLDTLEQERKEAREKKEQEKKCQEERKATERVRKRGELIQEKEALEAELANLNGLFTGRRRRNLEIMIAEMERKLNLLE